VVEWWSIGYKPITPPLHYSIWRVASITKTRLLCQIPLASEIKSVQKVAADTTVTITAALSDGTQSNATLEIRK